MRVAPFARVYPYSLGASDMVLRNILSSIAFTAVLVAAGQALAHAELLTSSPAARATVSSPKEITLTFSEALVSKFSGFELTMLEHNMKVDVKTTVSADGTLLSGTFKGPLMKGAYKIAWRAATKDGHRMTGEVPFTVQ